jgi:hypothetical protein
LVLARCCPLTRLGQNTNSRRPLLFIINYENKARARSHTQKYKFYGVAVMRASAFRPLQMKGKAPIKANITLYERPPARAPERDETRGMSACGPELIIGPRYAAYKKYISARRTKT